MPRPNPRKTDKIVEMPFLALLLVLTLGQAQQVPPPTTPPPTGDPTSILGRKSPPMPQQKQSLDYFAGTWTVRRLGAESDVAPGPGNGKVTFAPTSDGKMQARSELAVDGGGTYRETAVLTFDASTKSLGWNEQRPGGVKVIGKGDWSSPIAIRFEIDPVKLKGQTYQIKRTMSIISATSFSIVEELSVNNGPFVRLGNSLYTKQ
jgi:hypothetical protein